MLNISYWCVIYPNWHAVINFQLLKSSSVRPSVCVYYSHIFTKNVVQFTLTMLMHLKLCSSPLATLRASQSPSPTSSSDFQQISWKIKNSHFYWKKYSCRWVLKEDSWLCQLVEGGGYIHLCKCIPCWNTEAPHVRSYGNEFWYILYKFQNGWLI